MMARFLPLQTRLLQNKCSLQNHSKAFCINKAHILLRSNVCNVTRYPKSVSKVYSQNICRRMFYSLFKKLTVKEVQLSDRIPPQFVLIYNNKMKNYLLYGHLTVYICIFATFMLVLLLKNYPSSESDRKAENTGIHFGDDQLISFSALVAFGVTLQILILRMPIRVYNNPKTNEYAFIYYGLIPNNRKKIYCKLTDIVKQEEKGLLPWKNSRFIIKERENAILIDRFFHTPSDLNIILGYEKPPNDE